MKQRRWDAAAETLQTLLKDHPKHELAQPGAAPRLGTCLQEQKKWEAAATTFRDVLATGGQDKDQARLLYELAWSQREAGQEKESLDSFKRTDRQVPRQSAGRRRLLLPGRGEVRRERRRTARNPRKTASSGWAPRAASTRRSSPWPPTSA